MLFTFTNEYCDKLDELSDPFRRELNIAESDAEESDMESESNDDGDQQPEIHEVEITAMERLQMEMRMYEGYMEYLDTRPPDEAPPTTPIRKPKGQVFNGFQGLPNFSVKPL